MLMEKSLVENGFIIDLSNIQNTSQLVFELSSIMEHPEVKGKNICLKLGSLDLKQSQLLSIKALVESMSSSLASIDTLSEQKIQEAFNTIMQGRTSFIVAHRLSTIKESDVILVMKDGNIIEQGRHDELLARKGFYAKLYNSQFEQA